MFRKTVTTIAIMSGVWLVGVGILATGPFGDDSGERTTVRPANAIVSVPYQDPSGKYTVYIRTPMVAPVELHDVDSS